MPLNEMLQDFINAAGFYQWGASPLEKPMSFSFYETWVRQGYHGEMKYLDTHLPIKENPSLKWPSLNSVINFSIPYYPLTETNFPLKNLKVAFYAENNDYHYWVKEKLQDLSTKLKAQFPDEEFVVAVDASPLMERDLAYKSGLGWFGKNTCMIHPKKGSLFFLAEVLTTMKLENKAEPIPDFCGKCTRCIDVCPTNAIEEPRVLNAQKCISYWTIESRQLPPTDLREKIGTWFFGCDLCQTVCPWNQKVFTSKIHRAEKSRDEENIHGITEELRFILTSSGKALEKIFAITPLARAGNFGLKRNAIIVATNLKLAELKNEIAEYQNHEKLGELARWSLKKLSLK